jgi:hypothetical protein
MTRVLHFALDQFNLDDGRPSDPKVLVSVPVCLKFLRWRYPC